MRRRAAAKTRGQVAVLAAFVIAVATAAPAPAKAPDEPTTTAAALASFRLEPGLRIELVAAEPLVESPCAVAWDERGRLFVAENRGYPTGPPPGEPPQGRIALLDDTDGDGTPDRRVEFAAGLTFPNGLMPWRGGWLVTCAPDLLYLKDTDGDGRADLRQVWFTGFSTSGSTQLRASHPTLAIDNWIYVTGGLTGGKIASPLWPEHVPVELGRADFRFRPEQPEFESADGGGQFGMTFDEFGRRFVCYNRVQAQHVVLASRYLRRHPRLAFARTLHNCPAEVEAEPLPGHGAAARLYPISDNITTADSHAGAFTAACGATIFRGTGLPAAYRGGVFACEPTGNLVHFDRLEPFGTTFAAHRSPEPIEFLASPDNWFRPVNLAVGPDGALYVCDMGRKTIEHPDYLPGDVRKQTDFEGGKSRGRIYRVVAEEARKHAASSGVLLDRASLDRVPLDRVPLDRANIEQLCAALGDTEGWRRDTAQRLLLERRDPAATPFLRQTASAADSPPVGVVQSLRLLEALGALDDAMLIAAFAHSAPGVREQALQMAEARLAGDASLLAVAAPLADDPDARVRFQWALSVGASDDPQSLARLAGIAARDASDPWLRAAALSATQGRELRFLRQLSLQPSRAAGSPALYEELGRLIGASLPRSELAGGAREIVAALPGRDIQEQCLLLAGFAAALKGRPEAMTLGAVIESGGETLAHARVQIEAAAARAGAIAHDAGQPAQARVAALKLLASDGELGAGAELLGLVDAAQPAVQAAAIRAIAARRDLDLAKQLLAAERFSGYSPAQRAETLDALFAEPPLLPAVLDALESGAVPRGAIDSIRRRQLTAHRDAAIRDRAARLFSPAAAGDRGKVYEDYKSVADLPGHAAAGHKVFLKSCANCHRLNREGFAVGPDLFGIRNQPKQVILLHLLLPEYEIAPGFATYLVETQNGRAIAGLLAAETDTSVTLRQALGKEETILRGDIESLTASKLSLMPQELEKTMSRQEMADLLAYLKGEAK